MPLLIVENTKYQVNQLHSEAADDNGIERILTATLHNSGAVLSKFPFHQTIGSTLSTIFWANWRLNTPVWVLYLINCCQIISALDE